MLKCITWPLNVWPTHNPIKESVWKSPFIRQHPLAQSKFLRQGTPLGNAEPICRSSTERLYFCKKLYHKINVEQSYSRNKGIRHISRGGTQILYRKVPKTSTGAYFLTSIFWRAYFRGVLAFGAVLLSGTSDYKFFSWSLVKGDFFSF